MIGSEIKTLKETILESLIDNPQSGKKLFAWLAQEGHSVSIQGVYKQLNALIKEEVVIKKEKKYMLSNEWIQGIKKLLTIQGYELPKEGERFSYSFNTLQDLDIHWKHIVQGLIKNLPQQSMYSYCPHQIWPWVPKRLNSEKNISISYEEEGRYNYFIVGGETTLDKRYRKEYRNNFFKIELLPHLFPKKRHEHISIIGDTLVYSKTDKKQTEIIDAIYENTGVTAKDQLAKLIQVLEKPYRSKIIVETNHKKAEYIKRQLSKPFYIQD